MTEVLLFHHALGLTPGIIALGDELRAVGHVVHTPDLYDGQTFATIEEGLAYVEDIGGMKTIVQRGTAVAGPLPTTVAYIGVSLGVVPAQKLAQTRPGALGAVFISACVPFDFFAGTWPAGVPVQIHGMTDDPIFNDEGDREAAEALVAIADFGELVLYPGDAHLFADPSLPAYAAEAADLLRAHILHLLAPG
jgi:dienelactone hydrolase